MKKEGFCEEPSINLIAQNVLTSNTFNNNSLCSSTNEEVTSGIVTVKVRIIAYAKAGALAPTVEFNPNLMYQVKGESSGIGFPLFCRKIEVTNTKVPEAGLADIYQIDIIYNPPTQDGNNAQAIHIVEIERNSNPVAKNGGIVISTT